LWLLIFKNFKKKKKTIWWQSTNLYYDVFRSTTRFQ